MEGTLRRAVTALAVAIGAALAVSGASAQAPKPQRGGTLTVGVVSDMKTLDPIYSVQFTERPVLYLVFNTLVKFGPDFSIKPELAESWTLEKDGQRVVFKLRSGVMFHDGTPFNAAAVKWNIDARLDPANASPQRGQIAPVIESVDAIDENTVAFNLKQRFLGGLLSLLGERPGFMVSPTEWKKAGKDFGGHPVGTGAFIFKEWVRGNRVVVERNSNYWEKGLPHLDRVVFSDLAGAVVGAQRLLTGEIDYVGDLTPQDVRQLEGKTDIQLKPITVGRWYSLQWHMNEAPFNNAKLRDAVAYAIDRKRINDIVMRGKGTISESPTPAGLWWYDASIKSRAHDPNKAKALLKEAGYSGAEIVLSTPQVAAFQQINQLVQEQLGAVGMKARLEPASSAEWYDRVVKGVTNWTPTRWTQRPDPDGMLYILFHTKGYANTTKYSNPKVDALLDKAREVNDQAERKKIYSEAQKLIVADLPMLPLFFSTEYAALRSGVRNFVWIPDQIPRFREVWKEAKK